MSNGGDDGCLAGCLTILYAPGMTLAMIISWELNHSILWAIIHGYLSWGYIVYYALFR